MEEAVQRRPLDHPVPGGEEERLAQLAVPRAEGLAGALEAVERDLVADEVGRDRRGSTLFVRSTVSTIALTPIQADQSYPVMGRRATSVNRLLSWGAPWRSHAQCHQSATSPPAPTTGRGFWTE